MEQLYTTLIELFPSDIINIILPYSDNAIIIKLQNYFPKLLKHITVYKQEIFEIHGNNYQYITAFDCNGVVGKDIDTYQSIIKHLVNLTKLNCSDSHLTDASIKHLVKLTKLDCIRCDKIIGRNGITDQSIQHLVNLTELRCSHSVLTDASIKHLVNLKKLDCSGCYRITDASIKHLVNLSDLCCFNSNLIHNFCEIVY